MKQYCRYCSELVVGDVPYCRAYEKVLSESAAKRVNTCRDFDLNPMDAFGENLEGYHPRREKTPDELVTERNQLRFI